jgi:hypothetical protein
VPPAIPNTNMPEDYTPGRAVPFAMSNRRRPRSEMFPASDPGDLYS